MLISLKEDCVSENVGNAGQEVVAPVLYTRREYGGLAIVGSRLKACYKMNIGNELNERYVYQEYASPKTPDYDLSKTRISKFTQRAADLRRPPHCTTSRITNFQFHLLLLP